MGKRPWFAEVDLLRGYVGFGETWAEKPLSRVERVELATARHEIVFEECYWIGHVNTSPTDPDLLAFCHEGPWDKIDHPRAATGNRVCCADTTAP